MAWMRVREFALVLAPICPAPPEGRVSACMVIRERGQTEWLWRGCQPPQVSSTRWLPLSVPELWWSKHEVTARVTSSHQEHLLWVHTSAPRATQNPPGGQVRR